MQSAVVFVSLLAAASANTIFRSPAHDSAIIKQDRQGGSFAYSVAEAPAWGVVNPVVSHVTQPIATTYAMQQPATNWVNTVPAQTSTIVQQPAVATTYAMQQPATNWVNTVPAQTSTIVTGATPVVNEVKTTVPVVTGNVATTYGATWPYASAYTYGNTVVDNSSPIVYSGKTNIVGIETEKQINQVHHTAVQPAVTYTAQPSTATVVSSSGTPVTFSNLHQQQVVSTPVWSTVQQPANSIVSTGTQQWGSAVVSSPIAATTYSVPSTSVISTGTPVATLKTVGVNQWNNQWGYGYGQPWTGAWNQQVIV